MLGRYRAMASLNIFHIYIKEEGLGKKEDIGKEIRRMELSDVFTAFQQTKKDHRNDEKRESWMKNKKNYQFGTVIENAGNQCYKIESKGRVTVYMALIDKRTNKQITYESNLKL